MFFVIDWGYFPMQKATVLLKHGGLLHGLEALSFYETLHSLF
jgi:hypothetical protein